MIMNAASSSVLISVVPADGRILYFARDCAAFGFLSHFYSSPIELDGETWPTVEHYYQAQRSDHPAYRPSGRTVSLHNTSNGLQS
jgi:predicted NAD-dependent protein-ADP-ribosyltransferase YbiA (DUF1768 family)